MTAARRAVGVLVVVALAAAAAGCGVTEEAGPRRLAVERVPYGLLEAAPAATTTTEPDQPIVAVAVYFVAADRLRQASRNVSEPATVGKALDSLLDGVREDEAAAGLSSAINPRATLLSVRLEEGGVARVNLSAAFAQGPALQQIPSIAQVIFTATAIPGVQAVRFTIEGEPVEVPTPDGNVAVGPLGRAPFEALAPAPE